MNLEMETVEERRLTIPHGRLDNPTTEQIGKFITNAAQDGYILASTRPKTRHDQREGEYVVGTILTFVKP